MVPNSHKIKIASNQNKPKQKQVDTLIETTKLCSKTWPKEETFRKSAPVAQKITQGKHGKDKDEGLQFQTQAYEITSIDKENQDQTKEILKSQGQRSGLKSQD